MPTTVGSAVLYQILRFVWLQICGDFAAAFTLLPRQVLDLLDYHEALMNFETHSGFAHCRGNHTTILKPRLARLAAHAANTVVTFALETWSPH